MKNKNVKALVLALALSTSMAVGCTSVFADEAAADATAALIDAIYVQERTETTDADCIAAKEAWDALTDEQKELVLAFHQKKPMSYFLNYKLYLLN